MTLQPAIKNHNALLTYVYIYWNHNRTVSELPTNSVQARLKQIVHNSFMRRTFHRRHFNEVLHPTYKTQGCLRTELTTCTIERVRWHFHRLILCDILNWWNHRQNSFIRGDNTSNSSCPNAKKGAYSVKKGWPSIVNRRSQDAVISRHYAPICGTFHTGHRLHERHGRRKYQTL